MNTHTRKPTALAVLSLLLLGLAFQVSQPRAAAAASEAPPALPFHARYHGTFTETFGAGPGGTNVLAFGGTGIASLLGASTAAGQSLLQPEPTNPLCATVVDNHVTLMAANGDEVFMQNTALDCFDPATRTISGTGTYTISGGTGRFDGASGTGTVSVRAQVTSQVSTVASGTFDPLAWEGTISLPAS